jgi:hypothetical protein
VEHDYVLAAFLESSHQAEQQLEVVRVRKHDEVADLGKPLVRAVEPNRVSGRFQVHEQGFTEMLRLGERD